MAQAQYGLVIKDHVVRCIELRKKSVHGVRQFYEEPLPEGLIENGQIINQTKLEATLKTYIKKWKLRGRKIYIVVPNAFAVVRRLELPANLAKNEIRSYLFMEIGQSIHLPFDNPVFDTYLLGQNNERTELLLFSAPEDLVRGYVTLLEDCGTKPIAAEISPLSIYRLYRNLDQPLDEHTMFIQYDEEGTNVSIFKENLPLFIRQISRMGQGDSQETSELEFSDLLAEIERIMNFYQFTISNGNDTVQRIVLTGDHPKIKEFSFNLESTLTIPIVSLFNTELHATNDQFVPHQFQVNLGLALKEVGLK